MKFKKLNESDLISKLSLKFKDYDITTEDGDRWWYFRHKHAKNYSFNVGPVDDEPETIKDYSKLIHLRAITIDYDKKSSSKITSELNDWIDSTAEQLRRIFR